MHYKKPALAAMLVLASLQQIYAQGGGTAPLAKGEKQLNFGMGVSDNGFPVYVSYDFAIHKDITLTPELHVRFDDDHTSAGTLFKGDYHWNYLIGIPNKWDFYAGLRGGLDFNFNDDDDDVDFVFGSQIGGRWYWSEEWGLNVEFSGGTGFDTVVGLSKKL